LLQIFGRENLFIEIQRHHLRGEERLNTALVQLAEKYDLPLLATNGVCYATPAVRPAYDVFTCIRHHTHLDAAGRLLSRNSERHLKSHEQMHELMNSGRGRTPAGRWINTYDPTHASFKQACIAIVFAAAWLEAGGGLTDAVCAEGWLIGVNVALRVGKPHQPQSSQDAKMKEGITVATRLDQPRHTK